MFKTPHVCRVNRYICHRCVRNTTGLPRKHSDLLGTLEACQAHQRCVRDKRDILETPLLCQNNTEGSGSSESCQEHIRLVGDSKVVSVTPETCKGHHLHVRDTRDIKHLSGTPERCQACHLVAWDVSAWYTVCELYNLKLSKAEF